MSTAMAGVHPIHLSGNFKALVGCWAGTGSCDASIHRLDKPTFSSLYWYYRTENLNRHVLRRTKKLSEAPPRMRQAINDTSKMVCERYEDAYACLGLHLLDVGDGGFLSLACDYGDVGSCLPHTLEQLANPTTADRGLALLGDHCRQGAANACAWRLEHLRSTPEVPAFQEAVLYGQRACLELYEPVACAAAAKALHGAGLTSSAEVFAQTSCRWGYEPMCEPDYQRPLADEQPPQILGPSMLDQGSGMVGVKLHKVDNAFNHPEMWPQALPGRPEPPGMRMGQPKPKLKRPLERVETKP